MSKPTLAVDPEVIRHGSDRIRYGDDKDNALDEAGVLLTTQMYMHQTTDLENFTVNELQDLGCWDKPAAKANDLSIPIHPLYRKSQWERCPKIHKLQGGSIGGGIPGDWDVANPIVWDMLEPILRIATRLVENINLWQW